MLKFVTGALSTDVDLPGLWLLRPWILRNLDYSWVQIAWRTGPCGGHSAGVSGSFSVPLRRISSYVCMHNYLIFLICYIIYYSYILFILYNIYNIHYTNYIYYIILYMLYIYYLYFLQNIQAKQCSHHKWIVFCLSIVFAGNHFLALLVCLTCAWISRWDSLVWCITWYTYLHPADIIGSSGSKYETWRSCLNCSSFDHAHTYIIYIYT